MDASDNDLSLYEQAGSASISYSSGTTENSSEMTGQAPAKRRVLVVEDDESFGEALPSLGLRLPADAA